MARTFYDEDGAVNHKTDDMDDGKQNGENSNGYLYRHSGDRRSASSDRRSAPADRRSAQPDPSDKHAEAPKQPKPRLRRVLKRTRTQWECLVGSKLPKERRRQTDYVLVYKQTQQDADPSTAAQRTEAHAARALYLEAMESQGVEVDPETSEGSEFVYLKVHMPFWRLCKEAERLRLEMPIKGFETYQDEDLCKCWTNFVDAHLATDAEEVDYASSPLIADRLHLFEGGDDADTFFRPALRSFLTYMILINVNMYKRDQNHLRHRDFSERHQGLLYMLHKDYYCDGFVVHDKARKDPHILAHLIKLRSHYGSEVDIVAEAEGAEIKDAPPSIDLDTRRILNDTWSKFYKYQPLWKIRNYFGEKIALYFAWCGTLMTTLWIPMFVGVAVFFYGLYLSITKHGVPSTGYTNSTDKAKDLVESSIDVIKQAFDNTLTPFFALFMCIWGTVFLEVWKRTNHTLAYEWDVDTFESTETDRPQFVGTIEIPDPVVKGETSTYSPFYRQCLKFAVSASVVLFMVSLVFIVTAAIILYRIAVTVDYCGDITATQCLLLSSICSSLFNAIAILILGKLYSYLAVKLTDWENHQTQTQYHDSLVIKLFAFQFANSYTSLFYIAFFRDKAFQDGVFGLGPQYRDTCGDTETSTCMSMLSLQVFILMLIHPFPKFFMDVILPGVVYLWRTKIKRVFQRCCGCQCRRNKIGPPRVPSFLEREHQKEKLGDFTLEEYTEKVIIYGFLMLFATSFPLAPLLVFLILLVDIRVDAKRMLWLDRRPIAEIAQDIGMWYPILEFLNVVGVVSNACLIAFTSKWGNSYDWTGKLIIVIVFEHIVFGIKFIIATCIPDVPSAVKLAIKRERYQIETLFEQDLEGRGNLGDQTDTRLGLQRVLDDLGSVNRRRSSDVISRSQLYDQRPGSSLSRRNPRSSIEQSEERDGAAVAAHYPSRENSFRDRRHPSRTDLERANSRQEQTLVGDYDRGLINRGLAMKNPLGYGGGDILGYHSDESHA